MRSAFAEVSTFCCSACNLHDFIYNAHTHWFTTDSKDLNAKLTKIGPHSDEALFTPLECQTQFCRDSCTRQSLIQSTVEHGM